ncbi:MAG: 2-amino-4-hydroxy-6-hydroxymethyldihydropteridine diphosphokinase [Alphaproteobacteria bacterium]
MIVISLGANLGHAEGTARDTLEAALAALNGGGVRVAARSRWYRSAPVPPSGQPDYINGAALAETQLGPLRLLELMHRIEADFGRLRGERWAARTLDLDLADYHGFTTFNGWRGGRPGPVRTEELCLPHPRAHERAFVLRPLMEIAPHWRHPVFGLKAEALLCRYAAGQRCEPLEPEAG